MLTGTAKFIDEIQKIAGRRIEHRGRGEAEKSGRGQCREMIRQINLSPFVPAENNHLGRAAATRDKAREAEVAENYDAAWGFYQEQKSEYLQHAQKNKFTALQALALDASVSEALANILRLEGKHADALAHILYWVSTSARPTKNQEKKLNAYFKRCQFSGVSESDMRTALQSLRRDPQFPKVSRVVATWCSQA